MKKIKNIILAILLVIVLFSLTACGDDKKEDNSNKKQEEKNMSPAQKFALDLSKLTEEEIKANAEKQMAEPNKGDTIAIFHIKDYGDVKVKFFEDVAPKACENFITHAREGYYNGVTFHRVINEFMIQGGDPTATGRGGESIWGKGFEEELSPKALPYKGALCMASAGVGTSSLGSQFYIVQANYNETMESYYNYYGYSNLLSSYRKYSGDLYDLAIYGQYTTFGQVIEGIEIVDKISQVETIQDDNTKKDKPVQDVVISSIEITTY